MMKLRPKLEPHLEQQGLTFEDVRPALEQVDTIKKLQAAFKNPSEFLEKLARSTGPAAKKYAMMKLRPKLKPHLEEQGLTFEDVRPALEQVDTIEELRDAVANPSEFLYKLAESTVYPGSSQRRWPQIQKDRRPLGREGAEQGAPPTVGEEGGCWRCCSRKKVEKGEKG